MSAVSNHARKRGHERLGLDAKAMERTAEKALRDGLKIEDMHGTLRRWADAKRPLNPGSALVLYGEQVFIFRGGVLATCYGLPPEVRRSARGQWALCKKTAEMAAMAGEVRCG